MLNRRGVIVAIVFLLLVVIGVIFGLLFGQSGSKQAEPLGTLARTLTLGAGHSRLPNQIQTPTTAPAAQVFGWMKQYVSVTWAPIINATGYSLLRDGSVVATAGQNATQTKFFISVGGVHTLSVFPLFGATTTTSATTTAPTTTQTTPTTTSTPTTTASTTTVATGNYDSTVLADGPVAYWGMSGSGSETDLTGNGHTGTYKGTAPTSTTLPNGEHANVFNGTNGYMTVPSSAAFSIPSTQQLTWEAWIKPSTLQWAGASDPYGYGYVDWMGKCENYSPNCEWESRFYASTNPEGRCNRLSAYVFNPGAGLGGGADWQPTCGLFQANTWYHVVGEYQTQTTPSGCNATYRGGIDIWVDGVKWSQASHSPTGCMSQYSIRPQTGNSPLDIGTMALDAWFPGAISKVAIYNKLLSQAQITNHFATMTGLQPSGSCGNTCTTALVP